MNDPHYVYTVREHIHLDLPLLSLLKSNSVGRYSAINWRYNCDKANKTDSTTPQLSATLAQGRMIPITILCYWNVDDSIINRDWEATQQLKRRIRNGSNGDGEKDKQQPTRRATHTQSAAGEGASEDASAPWFQSNYVYITTTNPFGNTTISNN